MRPMFLRWFLISSLLLPTPGWAQNGPRIPDVPKGLIPPAGQTLIMHLIGKGNQIYVCQEVDGVHKWKLKGPDAKLFDEKGVLAGRHFEGPSWEANDGSRVTGKVVTSIPSVDPASVSLLLLSAATHEGSGVMTSVLSIQRLATKGGAAPLAGCGSANENAQNSVPYEANYYFYGN